MIEKNKDGTFKSQGVGVKHGAKPVSVMLPPEIDEIVRSLPNRSEFVRKAIRNQLIADGLLPKESDREVENAA